MMDAGAIPTRQRVFGYHNPARGDYRLAALRELLRDVLAQAGPAHAMKRA
jgi:hypothetical protein